jgi:hypothetical protein
MERKDLKPQQTYYVFKDEMYFWSPDGVGGYWYDTLAEVEAQHDVGEVEYIEEILDY